MVLLTEVDAHLLQVVLLLGEVSIAEILFEELLRWLYLNSDLDVSDLLLHASSIQEDDGAGGNTACF